MDLVIIIGIAIFFGIAAISTIAHRNQPPAPQVILVRADQLREARESERSDAGVGIFLLLGVIIVAVWLL